ncbi:hypothetical protein RB595_007995 [Gaeumannomyces hyphopodioides]
MTICRFFQQGNCRYGNSCKYEHTNPNSNNNRFGAFGGNGGFNNNSNNNNNSNRSKELPFSLSKDIIQIDLTTDRPQWILSAYGPGRDAPEQLFGGFPREQSFEEIRLMYEEGVAMGNPQAALSQIEGVYREADSQMQNALSNLDGAMAYIIDAQNKNPNRLSLVQNNTSGVFAAGRQQQQATPFGQPTTGFGAPSAGGFGAPPATPAASGGGFGQPSALGQKTSAFGAPAFGEAAQPSAGGFGQPSALGQKTSAFGTPAFSQGAQPASAFGQPPKPGGGFGQPAFGRLAAPAFGESTSMGGAAPGGFGQPSALGQKASPFGPVAATGSTPFGGNATPSPFGQPAQTNTASPFGVTAASTNTSGGGFGQPSALGGGGGFGQPSTLGSGGGFGQPSALGQKASPFSQAPAPSPFSQTQAQAPGPFGAPAPAVDQSVQMGGATPTAPSATGFGQPPAQAAPSNPFGQPKPAANPFGQPVQASHPFGAPTGGAPQQQQPAGAPAAAGPGPHAPNAARQHPPASSYITKNPDGTVAAFKGKTVSMQTPREGSSATKPFPVTRAFDGSVTRIWNPDGPPAYYRDTEAPPEAYDGATKGAYDVFISTGKFQGGIMPEVPPLRGWCTWDF